MKKHTPLSLSRHAAFVAGVLAAVFVALPAMAAATVPAAPAAAAEPAGKVAPGGEIAFDDLPAHVGAEIVVTTKHRTVRRGTLTGASSISINLQLAAAEGGFAMSMGRENVVKVELLPTEPAKPAAEPR